MAQPKDGEHRARNEKCDIIVFKILMYRLLFNIFFDGIGEHFGICKTSIF